MKGCSLYRMEDALIYCDWPDADEAPARIIVSPAIEWDMEMDHWK